MLVSLSCFGTFPSFHIDWNTSFTFCIMVATPALNTLAGIASGPGTLPAESCLMAFRTSQGGQLIKVLTELHLRQAGMVSSLIQSVQPVSPRSSSSHSAVESHLYWGGREEPAAVVFAKQSSRHHKALAVMEVCIALDFIGLLSLPRVLHQAEFPLHLLFSVCKGTFLAFDVE